MSITKYPPDHPLTKAGLVHARIVRQLEVGLRPGEQVFLFPHGRMVLSRDANGVLMMPQREGVIPDDINNGLVFKEAKILEHQDHEKGCR